MPSVHSSWQLRIFLQVYAPIWRHLAYLDRLKLLVFFCIFLQLSSSCCAVSMIPKILFDHLCTKNDQEWQVNNYAKFVLLPLLLALGMNYAWLDIDIFCGAESHQSTAATCRCSFSRCPHNRSLWWELLESWSDLPWLAGSGMLHICLICLKFNCVMPLYHAIPCFQIVFAMFIIQFNASTPPAVIAPLANGAWCRILGLWEVLLQQICMSHIVAWYMLAILTMSSYFLTSSFALDGFTIFSYGWCHNPGGTCGEVNRFMKYSWIFNMEYMDQYCGFSFFSGPWSPWVDPSASRWFLWRHPIEHCIGSWDISDGCMWTLLDMTKMAGMILGTWHFKQTFHDFPRFHNIFSDTM